MTTTSTVFHHVPAARPQQHTSPWLTVKVALVSALAVIGTAVSAAQLITDVTPPHGPAGYVPGDPAWAHVTSPEGNRETLGRVGIASGEGSP